MTTMVSYIPHALPVKFTAIPSINEVTEPALKSWQTFMMALARDVAETAV